MIKGLIGKKMMGHRMNQEMINPQNGDKGIDRQENDGLENF